MGILFQTLEELFKILTLFSTVSYIRIEISVKCLLGNDFETKPESKIFIYFLKQ